MQSHEIDADGDVMEELAVNRTGIMINPQFSVELIQAAKETVPSMDGDGTEMEAQRAVYIGEASPIGSPPTLMPEPTDEAEAQAALDALTQGLPVLLDKLGERLAFERQGTRLYEALLQKFEALSNGDDAGPSADDLRHICEEELQHFKLLQQSITELGGDATVLTPSADVASVMSHGVLQIVTDPRTTLAQSLQAVLTAELVDNDGWQMLEQLATQLGHSDLAETCRAAFEHEQEHLENVRGWLSALTVNAAMVSGSADEEAARETATTRQQAAPKKKAKSARSGSSKRKKAKKK